MPKLVWTEDKATNTSNAPSHHGICPVHYSIEYHGDYFYCYLDGEQISKMTDGIFAKQFCERHNANLEPTNEPTN